MSAEDIARVTHEANRALQLIEGDPAPSIEWDRAPKWQRDSAIDGVVNALAGASPEQSHENWLRFKREDGWRYGPVKDPAAKTHPCMVPYERLPENQRVKDHLFTAIVRTLSGQ